MSTNNLADRAAISADSAIKSTQNAANQALDGLASTVQEFRDEAAPALNRATAQASAMAHRGMDAMRDGRDHVVDASRRASQSTVTYIQEEPVKSVLFAAAAGATLMALIGFLTRSRG
jgi:ElaB/YqjD/DUF883 family membrane-anchored ribosome-binding protein